MPGPDAGSRRVTTGALGVDGGLEFVPPAAASVRERFLTAVASTVDGIALRAMRTVVDRALMPAPEEIERLRREACFYQQQAFADDPGRFFAFLDAVATVPEVTLAARRPPARGEERLRLTFASPYRPVNPAYVTAHDAFSENHIVHAELWRHRHGRPRPTVIGLHGFGMGWPALDGLALMASGLFAAGLDVALLTLPLHGARAPAAVASPASCSRARTSCA
jgi:hypothetical protein